MVLVSDKKMVVVVVVMMMLMMIMMVAVMKEVMNFCIAPIRHFSLSLKATD